MTASVKKETMHGFAHLEIVLVGVVIVIIGAIGYMFYHNVIANKSDANTVNSAMQTPAAAPAGTTASIDQLTQQAAAAEAGVDSSADAQSEQNATSADSAVSNVGGAYDENNL